MSQFFPGKTVGKAFQEGKMSQDRATEDIIRQLQRQEGRIADLERQIKVIQEASNLSVPGTLVVNGDGTFQRVVNVGEVVDLEGSDPSFLITIATNYAIIDNTAGGGTLIDIDGGIAGQRLIVRTLLDSNTIIVAEGGNISLELAGSFSLTHNEDILELYAYSSNAWREITRSNNTGA